MRGKRGGSVELEYRLVCRSFANVFICLVVSKDWTITGKPLVVSSWVPYKLSSISYSQPHSAWLNGCIGKRNYRLFLLYINSVIVMVLASIAMCIAVMIDANRVLVVPMMLAIYSFGVGVLVSMLSGLHWMLIANARTTREFVKKLRNPKSRSCCGNVYDAFCEPRYQSYVTKEERKCTCCAV